MKKIKFLEYLLVTLFLFLGSLTYFGFVESQGLVVGECSPYTTAPFFISPPTPLDGQIVTNPFSIKICAGVTYVTYGELHLVDPMDSTRTVLITEAHTRSDGTLEFYNIDMKTLNMPEGSYVLNSRMYLSTGHLFQTLNKIIRFVPPVSATTTSTQTSTTLKPVIVAPKPSLVSTTTTTAKTSTTDTNTDQANPYFAIDQETKMLEDAIASGEISPGTTMSEWINKRIQDFDQLKLPEDLKRAPITDVLKAQKAETKTSEDKKERVVFTGKGEPNTTVYLYIFSDPIVVSVNTDSQGNWTYELDQSIPDGKHEVYVAVKNSDGTVKAKSNPLTFFVGKAFAAAQGINTQNDKYKQSNSLLYYIIFAVALVTLFVAVLFYLVTKRHLKRHAKTAKA